MAFTDKLYNRGSISTGYDIDNSAKFEKDNSEWVHKTFAADPSGNGRRISTVSMWVKRTEIGSAGISSIASWYPASGTANNNTVYQMGFTSDDEFQIGLQNQYVYHTTRKFRDTSAWYHIVVRNDSTQSAALDRVRIYINGVQETEFSTNYVASIVGQNHEFAIPGGDTTVTRIGSLPSNSWHFSGYIAEVNVVCDLSLGPDSFGEVDSTSGIWKPKKYAGAYNTNGFYLDFSDSSNLGVNGGGTGNFSLNNMSSIDQATDTPTNNFAVGNPLNVTPAGIFSQGSTRWVSNNGTGMNGAWNLATIAMPAGKWHCEVKCITTTSYFQFGISPTHPNDSFSTRCMYRSDGNIYNAGAGGNTTGHTSYTNGDIIGMSYDAGANTVIFSKNGTAVVTKTAIANDEPYFFGGTGLSSGTYTGDFNFGGYANYAISSAATDANGYGTFEYAPPTGYYALCTKNLAEFGG